MESNKELSHKYPKLLQAIRSLLSRQNLCNNNYLFKHMKNSLTIPLYAFVEQRKISQITNDQQEILKALQQSGLAKVLNQREVMIIEYPTIKISLKNRQIFKQIETILLQHQKQFQFTERNQKQYINLTIFEQDQGFLTQLLTSLTKDVQFVKVSLLQDMREGVNYIKKLKSEQKGNSNSKNADYHYSTIKPPQVFIRKAIESSEEEQEVTPKSKGVQKKKKYRQVVKQVKQKQSSQPLFTNEDFPSLK